MSNELNNNWEDDLNVKNIPVKKNKKSIARYIVNFCKYSAITLLVFVSITYIAKGAIALTPFSLAWVALLLCLEPRAKHTVVYEDPDTN